MVNQHFTYIINGENQNKIHNYVSNSPMNAGKKIVNRYLRQKNDTTININLTIINLVSNKKYYYKVLASKNEIPTYKKISDFKTIEVRYTIFLQKMPNKLIEFLQQ